MPVATSEFVSGEEFTNECGASGSAASGRFWDGLEGAEWSFVLDNDPALIPGLLDWLRAAAVRFRLFDDKTANRVSLALHEALLNGMEHGNLELDSALRQGVESCYQRQADQRRRDPRYRDRRLHVRVRLSHTEAVYVIRDEGPGFNPARLSDPTAPPNLDRPSGRGLLLIGAFMDELRFNEAGNQLTLIKRR